MKQLLILSGKGGTGKTTVASAFISLSKAEAYADCDVDAPNLHLISHNDETYLLKGFYGFKKANIDPDKCISCGLCYTHCRFGAVIEGEKYIIDTNACEGCAVCKLVCPVIAITMKPNIVGDLMLYKNEKRVFSTAKLHPGNGNSGLLVSEVKKQMKDNSNKDIAFAVIDGSPGIGCPVIASLSAVDMVLIVAEPSLSGFSDMERIIKTARNFETDIMLCVNKYDINAEITEQIKQMCEKEDILFAGCIPYDSSAIDAINKNKPVTDYEGKASEAIKQIYVKVFERLLDKV
ncbi:MAG TPA: 4Fe-4S binding protein [Clostridia bacterium]|nr:4Fe-4S binding protein [Clostridia bacterium]